MVGSWHKCHAVVKAHKFHIRMWHCLGHAVHGKDPPWGAHPLSNKTGRSPSDCRSYQHNSHTRLMEFEFTACTLIQLLRFSDYR